MLRLREGDVAGAREALASAATTGGVDPTIYQQLGLTEELSGALYAACAAYARASSFPVDTSASSIARRARRASAAGESSRFAVESKYKVLQTRLLPRGRSATSALLLERRAELLVFLRVARDLAV